MKLPASDESRCLASVPSPTNRSTSAATMAFAAAGSVSRKLITYRLPPLESTLMRSIMRSIACSWAMPWPAGSVFVAIRMRSTLGRDTSVRASILTCWSVSGWKARPAISGLSTVCVST